MIGLAVGLGFWQIASFAALLSLVVVGLLYSFTSRIEKVDGKASHKKET